MSISLRSGTAGRRYKSRSSHKRVSCCFRGFMSDQGEVDKAHPG